MMQGMVIDMDEARLQTLAQVKALLDRTAEVAFRIPKTDRYRFIEQTLKRFGYAPRGRADKSMLLRYIERMTGLSRQQVTRLVQVSRGRRLDGEYPFVLVDALFIKSREQDRVVSRADAHCFRHSCRGCREIPGVKIGDIESFSTRNETFRWLKGRGLTGVLFVVSDNHGGLTQVIAKHFQGASWQRCQVHLMRNLLSHSPAKFRAEVAAGRRAMYMVCRRILACRCSLPRAWALQDERNAVILEDVQAVLPGVASHRLQSVLNVRTSDGNNLGRELIEAIAISQFHQALKIHFLKK